MREAASVKGAALRQVPRVGRATPGPEYAQPLLPAWVPVLALLLLLAWPVSRARIASVAVATPLQGPCVPAWQVSTLRSGSFTVRAIGAAVSLPNPCAITVGAGAVLHASGDAALIRLGNAGGAWLFVPESGWWGVPLVRAGKLQVLPFHPGSHLQLAIYDRQQFAALR